MQPSYHAKERLDVVHGNQYGPVVPAMYGRKVYFILLADNMSHYIHVAPPALGQGRVGPVRLAYKPYFFQPTNNIFFLTTNQPTVLSAMAYQPNEQGKRSFKLVLRTSLGGRCAPSYQLRDVFSALSVFINN